MVSPTCLCKELSIYLMWRLSFRKLNLPHPIGSFLPSVLVIKLAKVRQRDTRSTDSIWATTVQGQGHGCPTSAVTQDPATWRAYRRLNALLLSAKMKFLVFEQEVHTLIFFFFGLTNYVASPIRPLVQQWGLRLLDIWLNQDVAHGYSRCGWPRITRSF